MKRLSPREKTLLRLAAVAVPLYLLLDLMILPFWGSLAEVSSKADIQAKRVRNYHRILRDQGQVKEDLEALRRQTGELEKGLLESEGDALAGAEIQGLVKEIAAVQGLAVQSSDVLPVERVSSEYSKVSTRVGLKGTLNQFVDLMVAMGSGPKILFVENLRVNPIQASATKGKDIQVAMVISALKSAEAESESLISQGSTRTTEGRKRP